MGVGECPGTVDIGSPWTGSYGTAVKEEANPLVGEGILLQETHVCSLVIRPFPTLHAEPTSRAMSMQGPGKQRHLRWVGPYPPSTPRVSPTLLLGPWSSPVLLASEPLRFSGP